MESAKVGQGIEGFELVPRVDPHGQIGFDGLFILIEPMGKIQVPRHQGVDQEAEQIALLDSGSPGNADDLFERERGTSRGAPERGTELGEAGCPTISVSLQIEQDSTQVLEGAFQTIRLDKEMACLAVLRQVQDKVQSESQRPPRWHERQGVQAHQPDVRGRQQAQEGNPARQGKRWGLLLQPGEHARFVPAGVRVTGHQSAAQCQVITKRGERYELAYLLLSCANCPCIQDRLQEPGTEPCAPTLRRGGVKEMQERTVTGEIEVRGKDVFGLFTDLRGVWDMLPITLDRKRV